MLKLAPIVYLGRISYGLYVLHSFAIDGVRKWLDLPERASSTAGVGFILTCGLAIVSYHGLERPFLRLKQRFTVVESRAP